MPLTKVILILVVVVVDFNMKPNFVVFLQILSLRKSLQLREDLRFAFSDVTGRSNYWKLST